MVDREFLICIKSSPRTRSMRVVRRELRMTSNPYSDPVADSTDYSVPNLEPEFCQVRTPKTNWELLLAGFFILTGTLVFFFGAYLMLFKDPRSNEDDLIGLAGWFFGSLILGFGLAFLRFRWIASAVIGILSPGLTFGLAVLLFWLPALMAGLLNGNRR